MDNTKTIRFKWDHQSKTGDVTLFLKTDILKKYAVPPFLHAYHKQDNGNSIGLINYTYDSLEIFKGVREEIGEFFATISDAKLEDEDPYHASHLLYLLVDHVNKSTDAEERNDFKSLLFKRVVFLQQLLNMEKPNSSTIGFESKLGKAIYSTGPDTLTRGLFHYLITQLKIQIKRFDIKLFKLIINGASDEELKETIQLKTDKQITKALVGKLAKNILRYLNNETVTLRNLNPKTKASVSVQQGNFLYYILKAFQIYTPIKRGDRKEDDVYDDAIRKLVLRADITEDK